MQTDPITILIVLLILLSLMMAYYNRKTNKNAVYLAFFLNILTLEAYTTWLFYSGGNIVLFAILLNNFAPLYTLKAPLLYFFVRGNIRDNHRLSRNDLLHFIPAFIHLLLVVPYLLTPFAEKLAISETIISNPKVYLVTDLLYPYPHAWNQYFRSVQLIGYSVASFLLIIRFMRTTAFPTTDLKKVYRLSAAWLYVLLLIILMAGTLQLIMIGSGTSAATLEMAMQRAHAIFRILVSLYIILPLVLIIYPKFLYGFPSFAIKGKINSTKQKEVVSDIQQPASSGLMENLDALFKEIENHMINEKPYLRPGLKLSDISSALQVPPHYIQLCLSVKSGKSFAGFVDNLRVNYSQKLMNSSTTETQMMEIALKSGFISFQQFSTAFTGVCGQTPSQWLANQLSD